jgi:hypothetical protein
MKHLNTIGGAAAIMIAAALVGCGTPSSGGTPPTATTAPTDQPTKAPATEQPSGVTVASVTPQLPPTESSGGVGVSTGSGDMVTVIAPPPPTTLPPTPEGNTGDTLTVTMADNGKTISLHVGQEFLLMLGQTIDQPDRLWSLNIEDQTVISRVMGIMVIRGAQGLFKANQPGHSGLSAVGDLPCRQSTPPCMAPSLSFHADFVVK